MNNLSFHITDITANSIRANASEIGLSVEEQDTRIVIRITDNGLGMDAETARRVTNPFYTTRTTRKVAVTQKPEGFFYFTRRTEMTVFSNNLYDRRMERLMMTVPNFAPRGVGFRFTEDQLFITITAATPTEILAETMRQIRCPPFQKRFNEYIESEETPMTYLNEKHRARFTLAAKNIPKANYALLSALYLLTADQRLWSCCKHHIINGCVFFENIKLNNCTERAYTLYCAAKDLTLGTKHITVSDLSDADLVPPMLFRTICNAMAIRRFGLAAIKENCHD